MNSRGELKKQRSTLLRRIEHLLEGPMVFLGFVWLALLIIELIWGLSPIMEVVSLAIWILFVLDFLLKLVLAPEKRSYLKRNWLTAISLLIPAFRIFRVVRFVRLLRGLRSIRLVKIVASLNRSMGSLNATMRRRGFKYVILLTAVVIFAGAAGMYAFEKEGGLPTYGQALWWTGMMVITVGSEFWPQTPEGRVLCFIISIYGFSIFGYITATLASFFIGRDAEEKEAPLAGSAEIKLLQKEISELQKNIIELKGLIEEKHHKS